MAFPKDHKLESTSNDKIYLALTPRVTKGFLEIVQNVKARKTKEQLLFRIRSTSERTGFV